MMHNSRPQKSIQKRSSGAHKNPITFMAQAGRPLQEERAATSARARQSSSHLSLAGDSIRMCGRTSDTVASTAHRPIYIIQPPFPHPRSGRYGQSGLDALRRRECGADVAAIDMHTTLSFCGTASAAPSAGSGRLAPCCPASTATAHSWRVCTDRGRCDGGVCDADGEDAPGRGLYAATACAAAACTSSAPTAPAPAALAREGGDDPCSHHGLRYMA